MWGRGWGVNKKNFNNLLLKQQFSGVEAYLVLSAEKIISI